MKYSFGVKCSCSLLRATHLSLVGQNYGFIIKFIETNKLLKHARLFIIASKLANRGSFLQRHCNMMQRW